MNRRDFMKLLGVSAGSPFFTRIFKYKKDAKEYLIPFVIPPDDVVPGLPNWYSTVCRQCPAGCGIQVKIREGRAKKIEGNPSFPINYGRVCARGQAGLQVLYNPDRIKRPLVKRGNGFKNTSWKRAVPAVAEKLRKIREEGNGSKVVFLTQSLRGNLGKLISTCMERYGSNNLLSYELLNDQALSTANELCFGYKGIPDYDLDNAKYILSFGAGFLDTWISPVRYSVGYGNFRDRPFDKRGHLVHFEPRLSLTGASADEWFPIKPESEGVIALGIAHAIVEEGLYQPGLIGEEARSWKDVLSEYDPQTVASRTGLSAKEITRIAKEFALSGPSLAIAGGSAAAQVNGVFNAVASNVLNYLVGSVGIEGGLKFSVPSFFGDTLEKSISYGGMLDLTKRMEKGEVSAVLMHNVNPVFTMPKNTRFEKALENVPFIVSFSSFIDESTKHADFILPDHTFLESWGDYIPLVDTGRRTVGVLQPVVKPYYDTRALGDVILSLVKMVGEDLSQAFPWKTFKDYLKDSWKIFYDESRIRGEIQEDSFENFWEKVLAKGGWWGEEKQYLPSPATPRPEVLSRVPRDAESESKGKFHLYLYPSHARYDGRGANQPWLQQLPEPLVTATWGTWVEISPELAAKMEIVEGDLLEIDAPTGKIEVPAYIYPGIGDEVVAIAIGQGHTSYGRYAAGTGVNPLEIVNPKAEALSGALAWASTKVNISKTGTHEKVLKTDPDKAQPGLEKGLRELDREIVQWIEPEKAEEVEGEKLEAIKALPTRDLKKGPHFLSGLGLDKYRQSKYHKYKYRWGMVIDLDKCTGCEACMVACYAENNLPIVEPLEMSRRRHKNWIRVDRYWEGEYPEIVAKVQPRPCYHCGNAPCEPVCPVYAAFHSVDGLNGQVYQRCIGTRFCNVGCPYRVRLFNWFAPKWPKPLDEQLNTDISVRPVSITDKCTFCVQRLRAAKDIAKDEGRLVRDGEAQPACVQTCPSGAMVFGNLMDSESQVSKLTRNPRRYRVLEELNTESAVIYLKAIRKSPEHKEEEELSETPDATHE